MRASTICTRHECDHQPRRHAHPGAHPQRANPLGHRPTAPVRTRGGGRDAGGKRALASPCYIHTSRPQVDPGEVPEAALVRELREELGIEVRAAVDGCEAVGPCDVRGSRVLGGAGDARVV